MQKQPSNHTFLNWNVISKCLTLHYADKRDLGTLEYQMTTKTQAKTQTVEEFHQAVYKHLSLILNKIGCMECIMRRIRTTYDQVV